MFRIIFSAAQPSVQSPWWRSSYGHFVLHLSVLRLGGATQHSFWVVIVFTQRATVCGVWVSKCLGERVSGTKDERSVDRLAGRRSRRYRPSTGLRSLANQIGRIGMIAELWTHSMQPDQRRKFKSRMMEEVTADMALSLA